MSERSKVGRGAGWVDRLGTIAVFAWCVLTIGSLLL